MGRKIKLLNYEFEFKHENGLVIISYKDTTTRFNESYNAFSSERNEAVTPYRPRFNAEYAADALPEDVYMSLLDSNNLYHLKDWLNDCFEAVAINIYMEDYHNEKEDN